MNKILIFFTICLFGCGSNSDRCVKSAMFNYGFTSNEPTGVTVEQAMKICGVK